MVYTDPMFDHYIICVVLGYVGVFSLCVYMFELSSDIHAGHVKLRDLMKFEVDFPGQEKP